MVSEFGLAAVLDCGHWDAFADLIETRVIGGVKYILICADEEVEVNGVSIHISEKEPATV